MGVFLQNDEGELRRRADAVLSKRPKLSIQPNDVEKLYDLHVSHPNGCDILLGVGEFVLRKTVKLPSWVRILGQGKDKTTLVLEPGSNCHMFTNSDHKNGNTNIFAEGLNILGNGDRQARPEHVQGLTFACAFYFKKVKCIAVKSLHFFDIRQTALHFSTSTNVIAIDINARRLGWSGISSSNASNVYVEATVEDAGRDIMHSGIHMDGGAGVYVNANVRDTTGNGIMLDSAFGPLQGCSVQGSVEGCKRGLSLSGSATHPLQNVAIRGSFSRNQEAGVMISNSNNVCIVGSTIEQNSGYGILFQGRNGGNDCIVTDSLIRYNETDIGHLHASHGNWIFPPTDDASTFPNSGVNQKALRHFLGESVPWI